MLFKILCLSFITLNVYAGNPGSGGGYSLHATGKAPSGPVMTGGQSMPLFNGPSVPTYSLVYAQSHAFEQEAQSLTVQANHVQQQIDFQKLQVTQRVVPETPIINVDDFIQDLLTNAPDPRIDLSQIPNIVLSHQLRSDGKFGQELNRIYMDLSKIDPFYENRRTARDFGLIAVEEADASYTDGLIPEANFYKELSQGFLDIAVGLDPVSGFARSTYELFMGKNLITGIDLSLTERSLAFVGVATIGGSRSMTQAASGMYRIFNRASHLLRDRQAVEAAMHGGQHLIAQARPLLNRWEKGHNILGIHTAEHINQLKFSQWPNTPPFQLGSHVVEFEMTKASSQWVRVHGPTKAHGEWIVRKSAIQGMTAEQIAARYNIPRVPTHVSDVHIPAGTKLFRGNINDIGSGHAGSVQYWLDQRGNGVTDEIFESWFRNTRAL